MSILNQAVQRQSFEGAMDSQDLVFNAEVEQYGAPSDAYAMISYGPQYVSEVRALIVGLIVLYIVYATLRAFMGARAHGWSSAYQGFTDDIEKIFSFVQSIFKTVVGWGRALFIGVWRRAYLRLPIFALLIALIAIRSFSLMDVVNVRPGQVLVNMKNGSTLGMGVHVVSPLFERYVLAHVANYGFDVERVTADSSEPQDVDLHVNVVFHLNKEKLQEFYLREGVVTIWETANAIVSPKVIEVLKKVVNQYSYKEVLLKQTEIKVQTMKEANELLNPLGITVSDFNIVNIVVPRSYVQKIEERELLSESTEIARRRLEEERIRTETEIEIAERDRKKDEIQSAGLAKSRSVLKEMLQMREYDIAEKRLENDRAAIDKWDGSMPDQVGGDFSITPR